MLARLLEIYQTGDEHAGVLDLPQKFWPTPGQFLSCQRLDGYPQALTTPLFRVLGDKGRLNVGPLPNDWRSGEQFACSPPQGNGFKLPRAAGRIALAAFDCTPARITSLIEPALAQDASVALFCQPLPASEYLNRLPAVVEIGTISALAENLTWPDFLAIAIERDKLSQLTEFFGHVELRFDAQVLVQTDLPCHGIGECGVCAVKTHRGWRLACTDGPVFALEEVRHVAQ